MQIPFPLKVAVTGAALTLISGAVVEPVQGQTRDRIFGIAFGSGGIKQCPSYRYSYRNGVGGTTRTTRWAYPRGYQRSSPYIRSAEAEAREVGYACFVPQALYGRAPTSRDYRRPAAGAFEQVAVLWPHAERPRLPGIMGSARPQIHTGWTIDGSLEALQITTTGLLSQDQILQRLTQRFGAPRQRNDAAIVSSSGERETSRNAVWATPEFQITLQGIASGRRSSSHLFGAGSIMFRTHKAQRLHDRTERARSRDNL